MVFKGQLKSSKPLFTKHAIQARKRIFLTD